MGAASPERRAGGASHVARARVRAIASVCAVAAGFILAREVGDGAGGVVPSAAWLGAALLAGAAAMGTRGRLCAASMLAMIGCLSSGWFTLRTLERPADRLVLPLEPIETVVTVEGVVVDGVRVPTPRGALARFAVGGTAHRVVLDVRRVLMEGATGVSEPEWARARGRVEVYVDAPADGRIEAASGDWIRLTGRGSAPGGPTNPGQSDQRLWAAQDALVGRLSVPEASLIEAAVGEPGVLEPLARGVRRGREWLAERARAGIDSIGDERARALVASLMLGAEEEQGRTIATQFQRLGLAHVLAISGVHVAMLAWATLLLVRLCGDFGSIEAIVAAGSVAAYLVVVPAEAPVVRSAIMVLAVLAGEAMGRRYDGVTILAWTAVVLLAVRPMDLWSLGFQLSFGVTGVLLGAGRRFHARVWGGASPLREVARDPTWWQSVRGSAARAASASVLAWGVASPWIAARVGLLSPLAPLSSLIVGVPIGLLMLAGFVAMLVGTLVPGGGAAWALVEPLAQVVLVCVDWLDRLPGSSMATGSVPLSWGLAGSLGTLWVLTQGTLRNAPRGTGLAWHERWSGTLTGAVVAGLAVWLLIAVVPGRSLSPGVVLRLDTLDVGDATCHLIRSGDEAMLWDCGATWAGAGEVRIPQAVRALSVPPVRTALVTHANFDHFCALPDVAWRLGVQRVLVGAPLLEAARASPRGATAAMLALLRDQGVEIVEVGAGDRRRFGEVEIEFLWPAQDHPRTWAPNDLSVVAIFAAPTRGGWRRLLMTGDLQSRGIAAIMDRPLEGVVMEAPHHGAYTREAAALVEGVGPAVIVQSTGRSRVGLGRVDDPRWDEPSGGATWMSTARDGAVWVEIRRDGSVVAGRHIASGGGG